MVESWVLWLMIVAAAVGGLTTWLIIGALTRDEDDVTLAERREEADWIGSVIERHGGVAPRALVLEVLDLHAAYLRDARTPAGSVPPDWYPAPAPISPMPPDVTMPPGAAVPPVSPWPPGQPGSMPPAPPSAGTGQRRPPMGR